VKHAEATASFLSWAAPSHREPVAVTGKINALGSPPKLDASLDCQANMTLVPGFLPGWRDAVLGSDGSPLHQQFLSHNFVRCSLHVHTVLAIDNMGVQNAAADLPAMKSNPKVCHIDSKS
jgi:hypothetical protein